MQTPAPWPALLGHLAGDHTSLQTAEMLLFSVLCGTIKPVPGRVQAAQDKNANEHFEHAARTHLLHQHPGPLLRAGGEGLARVQGETRPRPLLPPQRQARAARGGVAAAAQPHPRLWPWAGEAVPVTEASVRIQRPARQAVTECHTPNNVL